MRVLFLHGFASSPASTKAGYFAERLNGHGIGLRTPDFNEPDFSTLTMSRMLEQLTAEVSRIPGKVVLIGSSLGGTLAVLAAQALGDRVDRLVLLAPYITFAKPGHHLLSDDRLEEWRSRGEMPFFHHGYNEERTLNYAFYQDSLKYEVFGATFPQPALVFQGLHDRSVDPRSVEAFSHARSNVTLSLLDDDHQLLASLPRMWTGIEDFLGLAA